MNLVSQLIDRLHPQDLDLDKYLYALFVLFPHDQTSLLTNLVKNKKPHRVNAHNALLLRCLYAHKNLPCPDFQVYNEKTFGKGTQSWLQKEFQTLLNVVKVEYEQEKVIDDLF